MKPVLPMMLSTEQHKAFWKNIRTWVAIANHFSVFSKEYQKKRLVAKNYRHLIEIGNRFVGAVCGNQGDINWLRDKKNGLYCAEMVYTGLSLGLHYPLNENQIGSQWAKFEQEMSSLNWLSSAVNPFLKKMNIGVAPSDLLDVTQYLAYDMNSSEQQANPFSRRMAIQPMSAGDIIDSYIQFVIPRATMGEQSSAPEQQGKILRSSDFQAAVKGFIGFSQWKEPVQQQFDQLTRAYYKATVRSYTDYFKYREAAMPSLLGIRQLFGRRPFGGAYVPPFDYMIRSTQEIHAQVNRGVLDWEYIGHGGTSGWFG